MAHYRDEMHDWVSAATMLIRFKPDREAVSRELLEHIEDKTLDIRRIYPDMTEREATQRALGQMGDPYEIGRDLAKIHKPWLGYLWLTSRYLAIAMLCLLLLGTCFGRQGGPMYQIDRLSGSISEWQGFLQEQEELFGSETPPANCKRLARYEPNATARLGNCTVYIPKAVLWQYQEDTPTLCVQFILNFDDPGENSIYPFMFFWAEDSFGNEYFKENGYTSTGVHLSGYGWSYVCYALDVPSDAEWIRFHYLPGTQLDLCIDLTKEASG